MTKRILSILLTLGMLLGLLPLAALAAPGDFSDVPAAAWYAADVAYVAEAGLMQGTGEGRFSPEAVTTRAMIVTILHRMEGESAAARSAFADVPADTWYTAAVNWAAENQIVQGMDARTFAPEQSITREQFAVILFRYAAFRGMDVEKKADLSAFADAAQVRDWAADAMAWANAAGIINGVSKTALDPQGSATRAQAAAILARFDRMVKALPAGTVTLTVGGKDPTVTEPRQTFTGTYTVENDQIERVDWVQYSENDAYDGITGTAMIDQTKGTWEAADILLAPEANTITFTAYTKHGATAEQKMVITYDVGAVAEYSDGDVTYTDDHGNGYVNNVLLVFLDAERTQEECDGAIRALCAAVGGEVIGQLRGVQFYQIRVAATDYESLLQLCEDAEAVSDVVLSASVDHAYPKTDVPHISGERMEPISAGNGGAGALSVPDAGPIEINDVWDNSNWVDTIPNEWNEDDPQGSNWWAEAIRARYAWAYSDYFTYQVPVGIADSGIDKTNPDLDDLNIQTLTKRNVPASHGTHVAGLIGAEANNHEGLTGMAWNKQMYNYDLNPDGDGFYDTDVITAVTNLVQTGKCKVINNSNGGIVRTPANQSASTRSSANTTFSNLINNTLKNYDFLIFQAAGNGYDENGYTQKLSVNSQTGEINGNPTIKYNFHEYGFNAADNGMFTAITDKNAKKHVVVVAAAQQTKFNDTTKEHVGDYQLTSWSNFGSQVDVAAPGRAIYSTYYDGSTVRYEVMSGTSMATPITAGLAAMVWSINPDFTAADVKEIICSDDTTVPCYRNSQNTTTLTASGFYYVGIQNNSYASIYENKSYSYGLDSTEAYRMINAEAAVEEALNRTYGDGTLQVSFVNAANNAPVNNVSYEIRLGSPSGEVVASGTANGSASITLPRAQGTDYHQAQYYLVATGNFTPYTSTAFTINVGGTTTLNAALNGVPEKTSAFRIVLSWNAQPEDLDAHLVAESGHVFYKNRSINGAAMDLDDTQSYGPETITVTDVEQTGAFCFSVHDFTNRASFSEASGLANSGATVRVYSGSTLLKTYTVPTNLYGTVWNVFSVDAQGKITDGGAFAYSGNGAAIAALFPAGASPQALPPTQPWKTVEPAKY